MEARLPAQDGAMRRAVVLLPGLDGTGSLLAGFATALAPHYDVEIVSYPPHDALSYEELAAYVRARLPQRDFLLVGESFSGPIALRLAAEEPPFLRAVILGASFARFDLPLKWWIAMASGLVPPRLMPPFVLDAMLMGGRASPDMKRLLAESLRAVSPQVLANRVRAALAVDLPRSGIVIRKPLLYLRAGADRLMPVGSAEVVAALAPQMQLAEIPAPHFLFQVEPECCARAIVTFDASID